MEIGLIIGCLRWGAGKGWGRFAPPLGARKRAAYDEEGHKTLGNWDTTILNAYGNPINHYGDFEVLLKVVQEGAIKELFS